jgi:hypothetical protein
LNLKKLIVPVFLFCCALFNQNIFAQGISGFILNEQNEPIPYVNVYAREANEGTSASGEGKYYLILLPGTYELVFSSIGYQPQSMMIEVGDQMISKNIYLKPSSLELDQIVVKSKRKDPAYGIIQNVIDNKHKFIASTTSYRTEVYIKAAEELEIIPKARSEKKKEIVTVDAESTLGDPFEEEKKKQDAELRRYNMVEAKLTLNVAPPDKVKEIRTGYKAYGSKAGLFIPRADEVNFNFYNNMVTLSGIVETPVISPISRTAILSYKYKLVEVMTENGAVIYKIKVTARKKGNFTCNGYLYINDGIWNINRLELSFDKGALKFYDKFTLKQAYELVGDSLWLATRQELIYTTKQGSQKTFKGSTIIQYQEFENNYDFPPKFFSNEIAITTKEAYKRDSSYWSSTRPEPLTIKEQDMVFYRDSIEAKHNSTGYKDSIEAKYNKITLGDILYDGIGFRNHRKKKSIIFPSLPDLIDFQVIGGLRLGPSVWQFKRWESGKWLWYRLGLNIGLKNKDPQGKFGLFYRYDPHRLGDIRFQSGRSFYSVNSDDAYLNQLKISNFILHDNIGGSHRIELFNGFYVKTGVSYSDRQSVENFDTSSILNRIIDETDPLLFEDYQALTSEITISYTPKQKYITEPTYKKVLGSKFPTFNLLHKKGWEGPFASDINFDYGELEVTQNAVLGILGSSKYSAKVGKFFNTKDLRFIDLKRFRQSDPFLYSDPLQSFQLLDTSLVATDWFFEAHHLHHFNGALVNNIPLIKKTRVQVVVGVGALWVKESNYRHEEILVGLERVFKLGARRRLRLGLYGVAAESNHTRPTTDWKISIDIIDTWKRDWSY